jgi:hypothetical protein
VGTRVRGPRGEACRGGRERCTVGRLRAGR